MSKENKRKRKALRYEGTVSLPKEIHVWSLTAARNSPLRKNRSYISNSSPNLECYKPLLKNPSRLFHSTSTWGMPSMCQEPQTTKRKATLQSSLQATIKKWYRGARAWSLGWEVGLNLVNSLAILWVAKLLSSPHVYSFIGEVRSNSNSSKG